MEVDAFEDIEEHFIGTWTESSGVPIHILAICGKSKFSHFQFYTEASILEDLDTVRYRIDGLPTETIPIATSSGDDQDWISILGESNKEAIINGMLSAKKVRFEIFKKPFTPLVVSPDLEGFREAWEHVKPHCYPPEQLEQ